MYKKYRMYQHGFHRNRNNIYGGGGGGGGDPYDQEADQYRSTSVFSETNKNNI